MKRNIGSMGIVYRDGGILCYNKVNADRIPVGGYRLFHCKKEGFPTLAKRVGKAFKCEAKLIHDSGLFPLSEKELAHVYLMDVASPVHAKSNVYFRLVFEKDLDNVHLMPSTRKVLERFFALSHHYLGLASVERDEIDQKAAFFLCQSLKFFEKKGTFPKAERQLFDHMYLDGTPLSGLRRAHAYFLKTYELDINEYLERVRLKHEQRSLS